MTSMCQKYSDLGFALDPLISEPTAPLLSPLTTAIPNRRRRPEHLHFATEIFLQFNQVVALPPAGHYCLHLAVHTTRSPPLLYASRCPLSIAHHRYSIENRAMATVHITLCINHRGRFEQGPCGKLGYVGGEVTEIERVNVDTLNEFFINDLLKDIGYTSITDFYWLEPGKELDNGLKLLRVDMDIVKLYEAAVKNGNRIYLYTEHPVNDPVIVEENITPSKVRLKTCAKRNPTPKKTPRRRLMDDEAHSNQSQPSQNPIEEEQQPIHIAGSTSPSAVFVSLSSENEAQAAEQNNQTNTDEQVEGRPKVSKRRSAKRSPPTGQSFIPNPDPDKPPSIYVPVESEEFSDENAGYHCYESEELRSIASDEDADQPPVFPQSNADAPVSQLF
ncbi:uncharacterized protein DS421_2g56600 [Arachis hypogaea]|nr:uncharacterized protein DS421_2g56600 [Arachis hypogaea]